VVVDEDSVAVHAVTGGFAAGNYLKLPSFGSRPKVAKAALISWLVLALRTLICKPMARAAASTSLNVVSVVVNGSRRARQRELGRAPARAEVRVALPPTPH
jgi:hypothetical protein